MITPATSRGLESIGTCPELSVVVVAFMRFATARSYSGGSIRSFTTTYHDGFVLHAAWVTLSSRAAEFHGPWVAKTTARSPADRSGTKSSSIPFFVSARYPDLS